MLSGNVLIILIIVFISKTTVEAINLEKNVQRHTSDSDKYFSSLESSDENIRDKRALGIFLQGLVQALGYNTTPIQIASLPNPNVTNTVNIDDVRSAGQSPSIVTMPTLSRPRETLRFTGVVNFGNNSDLLGHLRQYETLFHGSATAQPVNVTAAPPTTLTPSPLLAPFLVSIPIPLAENLQYPQPILSVIATPQTVIQQPNTNNNINTHQTDDYSGESEEIYNNRNPNNHHRQQYQRNKKNKIIKLKNPSSDDAENQSENTDNYEQDEENSGENYHERETESTDGGVNQHNTNDNNNTSDVQEDSQQYSQEDEESQQSPPLRQNEKIKNSAPQDKELFENPEEYVAQKFSVSPQRYRLKLPIDNKPIRAQLMNSYGQSLEHDGQIDDSVADYFAKFKNPRSGIFDRTVPVQREQSVFETKKHGELLNRPESNYANLPRVKYQQFKLTTDQDTTSIADIADYDDSYSVTQKRSQKNLKNKLQDDELPKPNGPAQKISSRPLLLKPFDFVNLDDPYYKPVQYTYVAEKIPPKDPYQNFENLLNRAKAPSSNYNTTHIFDRNGRLLLIANKPDSPRDEAHNIYTNRPTHFIVPATYKVGYSDRNAENSEAFIKNQNKHE